jgi:hypothetical protein
MPRLRDFGVTTKKGCQLTALCAILETRVSDSLAIDQKYMSN